jgi:hypothetical protein
LRTKSALWIRILTHLAILDPDPYSYWECTSESRSMEIDNIYKFTRFPAFQEGFFTFVDMFFDLLSVYFSCENSTFCDFKV